jgi:NADP-dependent 3-hydroxy acid dehydrogenase YdfG
MTSSPAPVALVTGASSGIGQATASLLAAAGFQVFGTSRAPEADARRPFTLLAMDVCSDTSVESAVKTVLDQAGRIDLLVNNAGSSPAPSRKSASPMRKPNSTPMSLACCA